MIQNTPGHYGSGVFHYLNRNILYVNANSDVSGSSFGKNFNNISLTTEKSTLHQSAYFEKPASDSGWSGIPSALIGKIFVGYREVLWRNSTHVMVQIIEMYPTPGRVWSSFYNNGTWSGWKSITPQ